MRKPDASRHNPDPAYLRELIAATGLSQNAVATRVGIGARTMRYYLADPTQGRADPAPYPVQYAIEALAGTSITTTTRKTR